MKKLKKNIYLSDFSFDDLHIRNEIHQYKVDIDPNATVASVILAHLNSKPGFIQHRRAGDKSTALQEMYSRAIHQVVAKGAPLELYISAFSPKITNPTVTNGYIYPDMADLLTLIHLHLVAKGIREVYDYGFRFIIGYRGHTYQEFFGWSDEEVEECYNHLHFLKDAAEDITGVRNVIRFVDNRDLIETEGAEFQTRLQNETESVKLEYANQNEVTCTKVNAWIKDFAQSIDPARFASKEAMDTFLLENSIYFRALKNIEFKGGKHNMGICNSFPNILLATIRGLDQKMSIQISPFFRFHSHQRLLALRKNQQWETMKWSDMQHTETVFEPVYLQEFDYPFYFVEK